MAQKHKKKLAQFSGSMETNIKNYYRINYTIYLRTVTKNVQTLVTKLMERNKQNGFLILYKYFVL